MLDSGRWSVDCRSVRVPTLFLCGDVMTGRGIDQVLPSPSSPELYEPFVRFATDYVEMAESVNGPIPKPVDFAYIWGDALAELDRAAPAARIINLETSITTSGYYEPKGINYRMHPANVPCLTAARIDCCALANNHVLDWGRAGLSETLATLEQAGIRAAGAGHNLDEALRPAVLPLGDDARVLVFSLGAIDSGIPRTWAATPRLPGVAWLPEFTSAEATRIADAVKAERRPGDIVVLSIHWGPNWGYAVPVEHREFAHDLIDQAGIDILHGHSSHHPKPIEVYRNKPILYGCGDFLNDYEGISGHEEFRAHLVLVYLVTLDPVRRQLQRLEMTAFETRRFRLQYASGEDALWLAETLTAEGRRFGTEAVILEGNRLALRWPAWVTRD